jgi:hypothetical protein
LSPLEAITLGGVTVGHTWPVARGAALGHSFAFLQREGCCLAWGEATRDGEPRILWSTARDLAGVWSEPRPLAVASEPIAGVQLAAGGDGRRWLTWQLVTRPGGRRPTWLLSSDDRGQSWSQPVCIREDEPLPMGGHVPPLQPPGGPGTEHLLATDGRFALVASDRFMEWTLGLRPQTPDGWGETIYTGLRHHMPLPAALTHQGDTMCILALRNPTDFPPGVIPPPWPQVHAIRLDMALLARPDVDADLALAYPSDDLYRIWLQCRVDAREVARRPFIAGVQRARSLRRGLVVQSPRPFIRATGGVPRTLLLLGRGVSRQVAIQDLASDRGNRYYQDQGKDRYPETQGFHLVPDGLQLDEVKPGMVLVSPGWGQPSHRFTAALQVPAGAGPLPERALFSFWSHNFPGRVVQQMPPDPDQADQVTCRAVIELDDEVVLEDDLPFAMLADMPPTQLTRSPQMVGYSPDPSSGFRLLALGQVSGIPSSSRHISPGRVVG